MEEMGEKQANAYFLGAILRNDVSRGMIHDFARRYWKARQAGVSRAEADRRVREVLAEAVLVGFLELSRARPSVAAQVSRRDIEKRLLFAILASDGEDEALDEALDILEDSSSLTKAS